MEKVQVLNINKDTVLIFKINRIITKEAYKAMKDNLEKETGCTCIILNEEIELERVLNKKQISEEKVKLIDKDIETTETTNAYAEGKILATTTRYKYKDKSKDKLNAIYKAEIFEYESGRIDTLYECDKENNDECSKESCTNYHCCNHTSNKKYAKNYINKKYNN